MKTSTTTKAGGIGLTPPQRELVTLLVKRKVWDDQAAELVRAGLTREQADTVWRQIDREINGDGFHAFNPRQRNIRQPGSVYHARLKRLLQSPIAKESHG